MIRVKKRKLQLRKQNGDRTGSVHQQHEAQEEEEEHDSAVAEPE